MTRLLAAACAVALACTPSPKPSPDYERARQLWTDLVQQKPDAAADDPRADEVLALLDRVPKDSSDAAAAADLRGRIAEQRQALAAERKHRAELEGAAAAKAGPTAVPPEAGGEGAQRPPPRRRPEERTQPGAAPDAGPAPSATPAMTLEAFRAEHGDCVEPKGPIQITAPGGRMTGAAEAWGLKPGAACAEKNPGLAGKVAIFAEGKLASLRPASDVVKTETRREVTLGTLPDGGVGMVVDGGVVPLPPGATLRVLDGGTPPGGAR